jgi:type IV secretory pathway TrbL component
VRRFAFVGALLLVAWAPDAHADANSYLANIHSAGINTGGLQDAALLDSGNRACTLLRQGMSVDQIAAGISFADKRGLTLAAQHELCPDTLR